MVNKEKETFKNQLVSVELILTNLKNKVEKDGEISDVLELENELMGLSEKLHNLAEQEDIKEIKNFLSN